MSKNILITGCSSGLGLALAKLYLKKEYTVYGISRNKPELKDKNFHFIKCDLSQTSKIKKCLKQQLREIGKFKLVYLNAGMLGPIDAMSKIELAQFKEVMELNVYANKELLDILKKTQTKKIIAISSGASKNGSFGWGPYSLSKASLNTLMNIYSKEMPNAQLLAVAPGVVETPMTDVIRFDVDDQKFTSAKTLKEGNIQKPKEAAKRLHALTKISDRFESGSFVDVRNI